MVDTPTSRLRLSPPTVGGDLGTWGNTLNGDLSILDDAVTGQTPITLTGLSTLTLTTADGATDQARFYALSFIGTSSSAASCTVTIPANQKFYWVVNSCTNISVVLQVTASSSITIPADGLYYKVYTDGTNVSYVVLGGQDASDWSSNQLLTLKSAAEKFGLSGDITTIKSDISALQTTTKTLQTGLDTTNENLTTESTTRANADEGLNTSITNLSNTVSGKADLAGATFTGNVNVGNAQLRASDGSVIAGGSGHLQEGNSYALLTNIAGKITQLFSTVVQNSGDTVQFPFAFSAVPDAIVLTDCGNQTTFVTIKTDKSTWTTTGFACQMGADLREISVIAIGTK